MLAENKVKCYKEMCEFLKKDGDVKGLSAPEPRQNFDLIYYINDFLFTYSLMSKNDYLRYTTEIKLKDEIDEIELKRIADKLRDNDEVISIVAYDNYIKLQMVVQLGNMPEENAMSFVYEKAVYFHNKMKEKALAFDLPTVKVEYKGKLISDNNEEQYIGKDKFANRNKNIMGKYLDTIKVPHDDSSEYSGIFNGHAISDLKNNILEYKYVNGNLSLKYNAEKDIIVDDTLKESPASFDGNICLLSTSPTKTQDIESAINDMVSIVNYINNNSSFILSRTKSKPEEPKVKHETDKIESEPEVSVKAEITINNEVSHVAENNENTPDTSIENNAESDDVITATLFSSPIRKNITNNSDEDSKKEEETVEPETTEPVIPEETTKDNKVEEDIEEPKAVSPMKENKFENSDVQSEYMKMYKHMNEIYEERDNVFLIKETKLKERELEVEKEQNNIRNIRNDLNKKWNEYNLKQKSLNASLNDYAEKMKVLNEKEVEIAKATSQLEEEKKSYETKRLALDDKQEKYEQAKRNLLDEQSMTIELKNSLDEKEANLKLKEADIEKKIQMNNLTEHQLSVREHTLNDRKKENISVNDEELEELKANNEVVKTENEELKQTVNQLQDEMENLVTACNKQLKDMEQKANTLIANYKKTPVVDKSELAEKQKIISQLEENLRTQDKISREYTSLKNTLKSIEQEKKVVEGSYKELLDTNNNLEVKITDLEKTINEYKNKCEPDFSARATKELLIAAGYEFDLIPTEGDVIIGYESNNISICINESAKMIYAEKPVKKGTKYIAKAKDWNDESISAAYVVLNDKVICKKAFNAETVVVDVQDILDKFTSLK